MANAAPPTVSGNKKETEAPRAASPLTLPKPGETAPATAAPRPGAPVGFSGRLTRFDS